MDLSKIYSTISLFILLIGSVFWFGVHARTHNLAPLPQIDALIAQISGVVDPIERVLETDPVSEQDADQVVNLQPDLVQPGLIALLTLDSPREPVIRIIDRRGETVHEWRPEWGKAWTEDEGSFVNPPVEGIYAHGLLVLEDGSFVSNFEHYSTFRMDTCGEVVWKLENYGHHSVSAGPDGTVWVPAEDPLTAIPQDFVAHGLPFRSYLLQQVSLDGELLKSINLTRVLFENDLAGLLYMRAPSPGPVFADGDSLHLNDIESVPQGVDSETFEAGDLILSLRDISSILVLDPETEDIKWVHSGGFVRQHDPDVLPNGNISIYDNQSHLAFDENAEPFSRIIEIDPETGQRTTVIGDQHEPQFFANITGSHERLSNGNILVAASQQGRLLEFAADGELLWRYDARRPDGTNTRIFNAQVLSPDLDREFFEAARRSCNS